MDGDTAASSAPDVFAAHGPHPVYATLPDGYIRLLRILPDPPGSEIALEIEEYPLEDGLEYTALSYKWGSPPDELSVLLNGHRTFIRKNLWRFLHQARNLTSDILAGFLWIDALCINQTYLQERTQQVGIMGQIYQSAKQVIIWLGPAYESSDEAMDALSKKKTRPGKVLKSKFVGKAASIPISLLCGRPYWKRLWIFQEIVLARQICLMCGDRIGAWKPFQDLLLKMFVLLKATREAQHHQASQRLQDTNEYHLIVESPASMVVLHSLEHRRHMDLWGLMESTKRLRCAEPRDRAYALLGVASTGCTDVLADYTTPMPVLMNTVLRNHYDLEPPTELVLIDKDVRELCIKFDVGSNTLFDLVDGYGQFPVPRSEDMAGFPLALEPIFSGSLWWAMFYGHSGIKDALMGSPQIQEQLGHAAKAGNGAAVQLFLSATPDTNSENVFHALDLACRHGHDRVVEIFIKAGTDVSRTEKSKAHRGTLASASRLGHLAVVRTLLQAGANVNPACDGVFDTGPLGEACKAGHEEVVRLLIDFGADVNFDKIGALVAASRQGSINIVRMLLNARAKVNPKRKKMRDRSPLYAATEGGHVEIVQMLIAAGADVNCQSIFGRTPLNVAESNHRDDLYQLLLQHGATDGFEKYLLPKVGKDIQEP